jgi:hypothetical protein
MITLSCNFVAYICRRIVHVCIYIVQRIERGVAAKSERKKERKGATSEDRETIAFVRVGGFYLYRCAA